MPKTNKLIWQKAALGHLFEIHRYISKDSKIAAKKVVGEIRTSANILKLHPLIGQEEELLKDFERGYRYLALGNYKLIYRVKNFNVYIITIFDTRRNPKDMVKDINADK